MPTSTPLPSPFPDGEREYEARSPAWSRLGFRLADLGEGTASVEMTPTADMATESGVVDGGIISALADAAMGRSLRTLGSVATTAVCFDLKLTFISAVMAGDNLRATAKVVHAGRRTAVTECRIESSEGRLIATASATFAVTRDKE
jgi:uncharacterized protein (TIGR00369 family)